MERPLRRLVYWIALVGLLVLWLPARVAAQEPAARGAKADALPWMVRIADEAPVVVGALRSGDLHVLHAKTGEPLKGVADPFSGAEIWRLDIDASGELVAALTRDNRVWLWRWRRDEAPKVVVVLPGKEAASNGFRFGAMLQFDPTGERWIVGHGDGGARLLDRRGEVVASFRPAVPRSEGHGGVGERCVAWSMTGLAHAWSRSGKRLALATTHGPCIFRAADGQELASGFFTDDAAVESLALSGDGTRLVCGRYRGLVTMHDVTTQKELWSFEHHCPIWGPHDGEWSSLGIGALQFSPDEFLLAATSITGVCGIVLDPTTGKPYWTGGHSGGRMGEPAAITWLPGGRGFFFAFVSGVMPIQQVRFEKPEHEEFASQPTRERGTPVDVGWEGVGVYVSVEAICAVDAASFRRLWQR